jgi:urease accessory protein
MKHNKTVVTDCLSQKLSQPGLLAIVLLVSFGFIFNPAPALAHHAMDGKLPTNFWQGFLSGLAHPIVGLDHFAFIVAVGLLAALKQQGLLIPLAFILAAMAGTGLHLAQVALPGVELFVAGSILLFGSLLVTKERPNTWVAVGLAAIAGLFHGYAYGEAIFGAEMTPLLAYLVGFSLIQFLIAIAAFGIGKAILGRANGRAGSVNFQPAGWVIVGIGLTFLTSQIMALLFPAV